jgi:hypothetical protein
MILGLSVHTFTVLHVLLSFIAILCGANVVSGIIQGKVLRGWTPVFLGATLLTTVGGFLFPITKFTPALGVGAVSLLVFAVSVATLIQGRWSGAGRWLYAASVTISLYLNVFVALAQSFQKIAALRDLAPTGTEPSFVVSQLLLLVAFVYLGLLAVKRFNPIPLLSRTSGTG